MLRRFQVVFTYKSESTDLSVSTSFPTKYTYMRNLHWLKITERIVYKLCLLVYKCRNNLAPKYLTELLPSRTSSRPLRSTHSVNITQTYFKNSQCQSSSFSSAGPRAWNSLPTRVKTAQSLNSFKSLLKTHLFTTSYNE